MDEIMNSYRLSKKTAKKIMEIYDEQITLGLEKGHIVSTVAMLPAFLPQLPDGSEEGFYLGIDVGGTSLRVLVAELCVGKALRVRSKTSSVPSEVMVGEGMGLFNYLAEKLQEFLQQENLSHTPLSLGFVFSFPLDQVQLASAKLLWWTKGYNCPDTIGQDVVAMFQTAIDNRGLQVNVRAIMNDTVGTLAAAAYEHGSDILIGGVVSTGCNVSYLENTERIKKLTVPFNYPRMVVDTEWEEFGNKGQLQLIETDIDRDIDAASFHVGAQTQDKYVAGLYMGEHVRRLLLKLAGNSTSCNGLKMLAEYLKEKDTFKPEFVSEIIRDKSNAEAIVKGLGCERVSEEVLWRVREVCECVSERSAGVLGVALASLILHTGRRRGKVGLGGSLYRRHPTYPTLLNQWLTTLLPPHYEWALVTTEDGSGKGAALVAAVAEKLNLA